MPSFPLEVRLNGRFDEQPATAPPPKPHFGGAPLPEPVYPHHPELLAPEPLPGDGERHWPMSKIYRAMRGWAFPFVKSRLLPGQFHPIIAYLFTEYKCNLDCHYCYSFDNRVKGMLAADFEHYVKEIARVLDDGGTCVASCYLLNDASRDGIARGASYFSFPFGDPTGRLRVQDISLPEAAVAMDEDYVRQVHRDAGLNVADVRRGRWFTGAAHDQDVLTVRRR